MFLFVMGLPGHFADWCDRVTARLLGGAEDAAPLIPADTLEQLSLGVLRTGCSQAVVSSRRPSGGVRRALVAAGRPFLVALDDPRNALLHLVLRQGLSLPDAVQVMASSCAAFFSDQEAPGALVMRADRDLRSAATAIVDHFGLTADVEEIASWAAQATRGAAQHDATAWWSSLSQMERATVTGALAAYLDPHSGSGRLSLTWSHQLFFAGDPQRERAVGPIDITGRAHCILQGPDILVPPGTWTMSLSLQLSGHAADREFSVELVTDHALASGIIRPGAQGLDLSFSIGDGAEHPVSIRVSSVRAAFDGTIAVEAATLTRTAAPAAGG